MTHSEKILNAVVLSFAIISSVSVGIWLKINKKDKSERNL